MENKVKKMTKKEYFAILKATYPKTAENYDDVIKFIDKEIALLEKKNSSTGAKKPTAHQKENGDIKSLILDFMEIGKRYTITELLKTVIGLPNDITNQRLTAIVRQMVIVDKTVERTEEKGKAYFSIVAETDEE